MGMYFSCFAKKSTKRRRLKEALSVALPRAKDALLKNPPVTHLTMALEHLNLHPVRAKSVPTFLPEG